MKKLLATLAIAAGISGTALAGAVPEYPGGKEAMDKYIAENMKYPQAAIDNGIEGVVPVAFTVKADGSIGNIKIVRMIDPDLEAEAIRLVKNMPRWTAADSGDALTQINITFTLPE